MLYTKEGWLNWEHILRKKLTFNFVIGGRGTGKTYGVLKEFYNRPEKIMIMRRTQVQADVVFSDAANLYKSLNSDLTDGSTWRGFLREAGSLYGIYDFELDLDKNRAVPVSANLGYGCSLGAVKNFRGQDLSDVKYLIYDEFIPEPHEREIKNEGAVFEHAYETINRNRELKGEPPLIAILLANANNLACDLIIELGLVGIIDQMACKGREEYINRDRSFGIWLLQDSPISAAKKETALYKISSESFNQLSIKNQFRRDEEGLIKSMPIREFKIIHGIGGLYFYKHKSKDIYYCTTHQSGSCGSYEYTDVGRRQWHLENKALGLLMLTGRLFFENRYCFTLFTKIW